jgi:hypothetical protein
MTVKKVAKDETGIKLNNLKIGSCFKLDSKEYELKSIDGESAKVVLMTRKNVPIGGGKYREIRYGISQEIIDANVIVESL